jgi:7,8-dihydropterin-6-yl-methyl-4-(beta-D-ribofuranosyl)aminobenzene 5'-phosphate synthase
MAEYRLLEEASRLMGQRRKTMSASSDESGIGRRDFFCSGGSVVFSSLVAALLGGAKAARAQTISGNVPEVDRATVRVVTDNYHFALSPSGKIGDVEVGRVVFPLSEQPPEKVLLSEFGLSMHLETQRGSETRNVLIDFGYSSPTLLNNLDILGIEAAKLDAMVLSHGHYDHFGGMVGFLRATQGKRKPKLPLYIGGEECFCSRQFTAGPTPLNFGALDRKAIAEADLVVTTAEGPAVIADHAFVTGHIPRATFERVLSPTRMKRFTRSSEVSTWRRITRTMSGRLSKDWSTSTSTISSRCIARASHSTRSSRQNCRRR